MHVRVKYHRRLLRWSVTLSGNSLSSPITFGGWTLSTVQRKALRFAQTLHHMVEAEARFSEERAR